jgi:hypothetical protein
MLSGLCKPFCIAALLATDISKSEGSFHCVSVGKGQVASNSKAWIVYEDTGTMPALFQTSLETQGLRLPNNVRSASYRRAATLMIDQKSGSDNEWYLFGPMVESKISRKGWYCLK